MTEGDRWLTIQSLFETLLEAPAERRRAVLASLSDPAISAEVERLLAAHDELTSGRSSFLSGLDADKAHALVDASEDLEGPRQIGRYPVVRALGRGGMGIVYLGRDTKLDRFVALKLLPAYLSSDSDAARRLAGEARTASALDHANIATVHEIGEAEDGRAFIVMSYYDGQTLRERLAHGSISPDGALDLGIQLADGLGAAHRAGIVHRDVKPENLIVTRDGVLKILDFGIAKAVSADLPTGGAPRGTTAYMSPEQLDGSRVDARTDVWAAGVVLQEMLTGSRPFTGEGEALVHAIRTERPSPLAPDQRGIPAALPELIGRCLAKDPEERPATADDLAAALRAIRDNRMPPAARPRRRIWPAAVAALAGVAAVGAVLLTRRGRDTPATTPASAAPAVAVLPFETRGPDVEIWHEGMVDLLATNLDDVEGLRAIDSRTVLSRWRGMNEQGAPIGLTGAVELARQTGAQYAILGSVSSVGSDLRIAATVYPTSGDPALASLSVDGPADSLFSLVDRMSIEILAAIWQGRDRAAGRVSLARMTTSSLPALKAYLNGERHLRRGETSRAIDAYDEAIAADSTFAFAHYHLAIASGWVGEPVVSSRRWVEAMEQALRHSGRLPERERTLLHAARASHTPTAHDLVQTLQLAQRATTRYPDDAEAWYILGEVYHHASEQLLVPWSEGEKAFRTSVRLDPGFTVPYVHLVTHVLNQAPDSTRAAKMVAAFRRIAPDSPFLRECDLALALAFGDSSARAGALRTLQTLPQSTFNAATWVMLLHPGYWDALTQAIRSRPVSSGPGAEGMVSSMVRLLILRGELRAADEYLARPEVFEGLRPSLIYRMRLAGLVPADSLLDSLRLAPPTRTALDTGVATPRIFFAGAMAAEEGRWHDHAAAAERLRAREAAWLSIADSANARFAHGAERALAGYGALQRGDTTEGLRLLSEGQVATTWFASMTRNAMNAVIRWWLAETLEASGREEEAVRYYDSFLWDPYAAERAAPVYERIGLHTKARAAHELVAFAWQAGDPPLRTRAERARAALARLDRQPQGARTPNTGVSPLGTPLGTLRSTGSTSTPGSVSVSR